MKSHANPSRGSQVVPRKRMDRHDEASSRFSQFSERAQKWIKHANNFVPSFITVETLQCFTKTDTILVSSHALTSVFRTNWTISRQTGGTSCQAPQEATQLPRFQSLNFMRLSGMGWDGMEWGGASQGS